MYCAYLKGIQTTTKPIVDNQHKSHHHHDHHVVQQQHERRWLFHGTKADCVNKIIQNGFNRSMNKTYAYGRGTYFARDASMACNAKYATPDRSSNNINIRAILLCRVAVGYYTIPDNVDGIIPPTKKYDTSETYDTTVDNMNDPSIFVTYHDAQAYPEYLINFKVV
jgi:poly [ADP-ribose] polymerase 10/14/15